MSVNVIRSKFGWQFVGGALAVTLHDKVTELFDQFTRLRVLGRNRDEAWSGIETTVNTLSKTELGQLLSLVRDWESTEGRKYSAVENYDPYPTRPAPPEGLKDINNAAKNVIRRIGTPPTTDPIRAVPMQPACPQCGKVSQEGDLYCISCGALLLVAGGTRQIETALDSDTRDTEFDADMVLYLHVAASNQTIRVRPTEEEMVIGRRAPDNVVIPDIDLSPFQAESLGVSRLHAELHRQNNTLVLTDLGSLNHTHINGQRLHAHEVRVLHQGDEVRFGNLVLRVIFRRE